MIKSWLSTLPNLLLKPNISNKCLLTLTKLAKQKNPEFLSSLNEKSLAIIGNTKHIFFEYLLLIKF